MEWHRRYDGMSRCDIEDMSCAAFEAMDSSNEWHLNERQVQARRAKIEALKAASVDWPRMNESQIRSYHAEYGTGTMDGIDITTMPYMGPTEFKALSDAIVQPLPPSYVRGPAYDERVKEIARGIRNRRNLKFSNIALEFYQKSQDAEFEIVEPLYSEYADLAIPKANPDCPPDVEEWCHVSFIAQPKNSDCSDVSPKYFFGELLKDERSGTYNATYCSTFEPSNDPGFNHGCVFCPVAQKFHPGPGRYRHGRPPCYVLEGGGYM